MKKFWRIGLAAALSLALAACGSSSSADTEAAADTEAQAEESEATEAASEESDGRGRIAYMAGTLGDKSFIDSGEAGMNVLRSEGWEVRTVETGDSTDADKYEDYFLDILDQVLGIFLIGHVVAIGMLTPGPQMQLIDVQGAGERLLLGPGSPILLIGPLKAIQIINLTGSLGPGASVHAVRIALEHKGAIRALNIKFVFVKVLGLR